MTATYSAEEAGFEDDGVKLGSSWVPRPLDDALAGTTETPTPAVLRIKGTTAALFYLGCVNGLHGDSGIGKSWVAFKALAESILDGHNVMLIDYEMNEHEVVDRFRALGVSSDAILRHLIYIRPDEPTALGVDEVVGLAVERAVRLAVIDSLGEAFAVEGINEDKDNEVGPWLRMLPRQLADAGPAVTLVDHGTKAAENPLYPSGSKRKRAAITGASYLVTATSAPTRTAAGALVLTTAKDRHGHFQRGKVAAKVDVTPYPDGGITINLWPSTTEEAPDAELRRIARLFVKTVRDAGRSLSRDELYSMSNVAGRTTTKVAAIDHALADGALVESVGARSRRSYTYRRDLSEGQ